jgi:hypothetical protein
MPRPGANSSIIMATLVNLFFHLAQELRRRITLELQSHLNPIFVNDAMVGTRISQRFR